MDDSLVKDTKLRAMLYEYGARFSSNGKILCQLHSRNSPSHIRYLKPKPGGEWEDVRLPANLSAMHRYLARGFKIHPEEKPPFPVSNQQRKELEAVNWVGTKLSW